MSNVWFPVPVALFVRRVVNLLSSLSITHHYLLPPRSTIDKNGPELPSQWATRVQRSKGRHEAERRVSWLTIVEKSLDDLLQASGNISIPWFYWPARFSLLQYGEQANDPTRTENYRSSHRQEPPDPADGDKKDNDNLDEIHRLMQNPVLYDPLRSPRYPIVLCHGALFLTASPLEPGQTTLNPRIVRIRRAWAVIVSEFADALLVERP